MGFELLAKFIVAMIVYAAYKNGLVEEKPYPIFLSIIYYLIWAAYFNKSKRVLSYYKTNNP